MQNIISNRNQSIDPTNKGLLTYKYNKMRLLAIICLCIFSLVVIDVCAQESLRNNIDNNKPCDDRYNNLLQLSNNKNKNNNKNKRQRLNSIIQV